MSRHSVIDELLRPWVIVVVASVAIVAVAAVSRLVSGGESGATAEQYRAALEQSAETGRPVVLVFTASWCPPCRRMKREAWPDERVQELIADRYLKVIIDVDGSATRDIVQQYGIRAIPTILIVDSTGQPLRTGSTMDADRLAAFLAEGAG